MKILIIFLLFFGACGQSKQASNTLKSTTSDLPSKEIIVGADQAKRYLPKMRNKSVALVVNQTSTTQKGHLVDFLLQEGVYIQTIFAPEHGFRGKADAGESIQDGKDIQTGLPIVSLYGKNKKPSNLQLLGIDYVVFDIQDVGARFYTYISTMHYVMEACAENGIPILILDRPNPNGHYVDGPVLKKEFSSFVGMHQVPVVHGMTIGEYAQMLNGEGWLSSGIKCQLEVIPCANYTHKDFYELPINPSPNLPNMRSIYLYPSLCFFEGTTISIGRGTQQQFQVIGHPAYTKGDYYFTPTPQEGAKYPKHQDKVCNGYNLTTLSPSQLQQKGRLQLDYLVDFYKNSTNKAAFFLENKFIDKLAGTDDLRQQLIAGKSANEIRESWQADLQRFKQIRKQYLLYEDF